jgi:hypothetical protein
VERLLLGLKSLRTAHPILRKLLDSYEPLGLLISVLSENPGHRPILLRIREAAGLWHSSLVALSTSLGWTPHPFEPEKSGTNLAEALVGPIPRSDPGALFVKVQEAHSKFLALYLRIMGALVLRAEEVERRIGLPAT